MRRKRRSQWYGAVAAVAREVSARVVLAKVAGVVVTEAEAEAVSAEAKAQAKTKTRGRRVQVAKGQVRLASSDSHRGTAAYSSQERVLWPLEK